MEVNFYLHECTLFQDVYRTLWESTVLTWFILTSPKCPKYVHNDETFRGLSGNVTFRFCVCWDGISAKSGPSATKRKANIPIELQASNVTNGFDLDHNLEL